MATPRPNIFCTHALRTSGLSNAGDYSQGNACLTWVGSDANAALDDLCAYSFTNNVNPQLLQTACMHVNKYQDNGVTCEGITSANQATNPNVYNYKATIVYRVPNTTGVNVIINNTTYDNVLVTQDPTIDIEGAGGTFVAVAQLCIYDKGHYQPWIFLDEEGLCTGGSIGACSQANSMVIGTFKQLCRYSQGANINPNLVSSPMCQKYGGGTSS